MVRSTGRAQRHNRSVTRSQRAATESKLLAEQVIACIDCTNDDDNDDDASLDLSDLQRHDIRGLNEHLGNVSYPVHQRLRMMDSSNGSISSTDSLGTSFSNYHEDEGENVIARRRQRLFRMKEEREMQIKMARMNQALEAENSKRGLRNFLVREASRIAVTERRPFIKNLPPRITAAVDPNEDLREEIDSSLQPLQLAEVDDCELTTRSGATKRPQCSSRRRKGQSPTPITLPNTNEPTTTRKSPGKYRGPRKTASRAVRNRLQTINDLGKQETVQCASKQSGTSQSRKKRKSTHERSTRRSQTV